MILLPSVWRTDEIINQNPIRDFFFLGWDDSDACDSLGRPCELWEKDWDRSALRFLREADCGLQRCEVVVVEEEAAGGGRGYTVLSSSGK